MDFYKEKFRAFIEKIKKRKLNYAAMRADGELPREEYQALCKQADDEIAHLEQELKAISPAPDPQTVSSGMKEIHDFLSQKFDVHGARLAPELIDRFVEVVTPHCRLLLPLEAEHRLQEVQRGAHRFDGCIGKAHPYLHHRL